MHTRLRCAALYFIHTFALAFRFVRDVQRTKGPPSTYGRHGGGGGGGGGGAGGGGFAGGYGIRLV